MKITALLENTAGRADVEVEHGLSLYIETDTLRILFDMGQSDMFVRNAKKLGIDLSAVDVAILSHGHYDHGGGLSAFLAVNSHAPILLREDAFMPHRNATKKYIGLDTSLREDPRLIFTGDTYALTEHIRLYSCNDRPRLYDTDAFGLTEQRGATWMSDAFLHEQYLLIEEKEKRILVSGCSHKGILNLVEWFAPDVLVGGFHFSKMELNGALLSAARCLDEAQTEYYTCHCTGEAQIGYMQKHMRRLHTLRCGQSITLS